MKIEPETKNKRLSSDVQPDDTGSRTIGLLGTAGLLAAAARSSLLARLVSVARSSRFSSEGWLWRVWPVCCGWSLWRGWCCGAVVPPGAAGLCGAVVAVFLRRMAVAGLARLLWLVSVARLVLRRGCPSWRGWVCGAVVAVFLRRMSVAWFGPSVVAGLCGAAPVFL